jgi:CheY-like chemotaxis protein
MVYGFVRQSGGYIVLDSAPGVGTAFRLLFPATGTALGEKPASRRVLLVEDMADVCATVASMLETLGYDHLAVADAETALVRLDRGEVFDVLLTDIGLPGAIDGLALVDLARTRRPSLRIVTMTGNADRVLLEGGLRRAQHPHLKKPFRRAELAAVLDGLFTAKGEIS